MRAEPAALNLTQDAEQKGQLNTPFSGGALRSASLTERIASAITELALETPRAPWETLLDRARIEPEHRLGVLKHHGLLDEKAEAYLRACARSRRKPLSCKENAHFSHRLSGQ